MRTHGVAARPARKSRSAYVNFQKLLEEAPQTKTAMQALENEFGPRRRELVTMQNDLKARDEKLQKEGAVMAEADRAKAEKTLRDQQREFSRKAGEFQDDAVDPARTRKSARCSATCVHGDPNLRECAGLRSGAGRRRVLRQGAARHHGRTCWRCCRPSRRRLPATAPKPRRPRRRSRRAPNSPLTRLSH